MMTFIFLLLVCELGNTNAEECNAGAPVESHLISTCCEDYTPSDTN